MAYRLLDSYDTVQVLSPTTAVDAIYCTIQTSGHGAVVQRTVPKTEFEADRGDGILASLATAVDQVLDGGLAVAAQGTQDVDNAGLLYDGVVFTVEYLPPFATAGPLTTTVTVPVNVLTADTQFGSFLTGGSAQDRLQAAYQRLVALSEG